MIVFLISKINLFLSICIYSTIIECNFLERLYHVQDKNVIILINESRIIFLTEKIQT